MKTSCILPPVVWLPKQLSVSSWAVPGATAAGWSAELHQQILDIQSGQPTMAELTLPSALLHRVDTSRRWEQVLEQTKKSLPELEPLPRGYLYLRRTTASGVLREGLIALLDLEQYSFEPGNTKPVRQPVPLAVQQVIARAKMREESPLEGSPIRLICKYNQEELFSSLRWYSEQAPCLYQGELILSGGHLQAWLVEDSQLEQQITHLFASKDGELVMVPVEGQEALAPKTRNAHGEPFAPYEVSLLGSARGELEQISAEAIYEFEGGGVSLQVIFLPEGGESSRLTHGFVWRGQVDFDAAEAQTGSGAPVTIVVPTVEDRDTDQDFTSVESCFILGNGLYLLDVSIHASDREEEVRAVLDGLLALF